MPEVLRIATFNVENLDDVPGEQPALDERIQIMRPQLRRVRADIVCLQEVHSQGPSGARTLAALDQLLLDTEYASFQRSTTMTTSGELYDVRNLVVLSRFPIVDSELIRDSAGPRPSYRMATAEPEDTTADPVRWERPMQYVQIELAGGMTLHLVNVHFKSRIPSEIPGQKINDYTWRSVSAWAEGSFISSMKRVGQALQARLLIDEIFDDEGLDSLIAICGDFNAEAEDVPVRTICGHVEETGNPVHAPRLMVPCENYIPDSARYSLWHLGQGQMLDHIIVSRPLLALLLDAEIHNEALPDESGAFRWDTKFPESDHAPVVAEFLVP
jgi:endonuclease/exonuclease/phosphatase family metal-dependent hydrolase